MRLSMDCKATVNIGEYSRGGKTRGDNKANDHDMGCKEKYIPFGVVNEDTGELHLAFGSSAKTSDFIVDCLYSWWERQSPEQRDALSLLLIQLRCRYWPVSLLIFVNGLLSISPHWLKSISGNGAIAIPAPPAP